MKHETVYLPDTSVVCEGLPESPWSCPVCTAVKEKAELEEELAALEAQQNEEKA